MAALGRLRFISRCISNCWPHIKTHFKRPDQERKRKKTDEGVHPTQYSDCDGCEDLRRERKWRVRLPLLMNRVVNCVG